ncbi:OmpA family protein [Flavobacterium sp. DSR3-2]|uniref:OmpA family protein n=1 Tax=Flavobacterium sp. DSR3-2 TaxID=2804634 RepID=UPI003CF2066A
MKNKIVGIIFLIISINIYSQQSKIGKADREYDKFAYVDAIKTYESVFNSGYKSIDMLQKLANSYYFKADLQKAAQWYFELFKLTKDLEPEYYYRYGQSLKGIEDYKRADEILSVFNENSGNEIRAKLLLAQKAYLLDIEKNSGRYLMQNTSINSEKSDYGTTFYKNKIVFASARNSSVLGNTKHSWTGESFTNLYSSILELDGNFSFPKRFEKKLSTKYNESTPVFTKDCKTIYFTRNNFNNGRKGKDKNKITLLKLYKASLERGKWKNIIELPFNSDQYSVAHPALSPDEKTLYFASDMPGTIGNSDLFKVSIELDGTYGKPINLGNVINTEGRESFPFITSENELYFSSDGHPGLGGLDVFVTKVEKNHRFDDILNVGEPINSSKDDFGFIINNIDEKGFVSSNRDGGLGNDDIYQFDEIKKIEYNCEQSLFGLLMDHFTGAPLGNAKVLLSDISFNIVGEVVTDLNGKFRFGMLDCNSRYYIKAEKRDYDTYEISAFTTNQTKEIFLPIRLEKTIQKIKEGDDLAKVFTINKIYFAFDKYDIRADVEADLAIIMNIMKEYPTIKIDVRSHTDSRQSDKYNNILSEKRAQSTIAWLVQHEVNPSRLTGKGYGEIQLTNKCADNIECTEEEHKANRRSEFIITSI